MVDFLHSLPDLSIAALFCTVVALIFAAAPLLRERVLGDISERTGDLFSALTHQVLALQPASGRASVIYSDMVRTVDQLSASREDRLRAADLRLPSIFWEAIGFLMALLVAFAAFVERQRALSLGGLGAGLALLITLVFIFDQPLLGHVSATPEPIAKALHERGS